MTSTEDLLKDFIMDETVDFEIKGRKYKYKPVSGGDENKWINEYIERDNEGNLKENLQKLNECKLRNIVEVPYSREVIEKVIGVNKEWKNLSKEERIKLLDKLNPTLFSAIITNINQIDKRNKGDIKNL